VPGTPHTLLCPRCGYDLSGIAGETGDCPECGRRFSRLVVRREFEALTRLALGLVTYATAALVGAFVIAQCMAKVHPPSEGPPLYLLSLLPAALLALGVSLLSIMTGATAFSRGWPAAIGVLFFACSLFAAAALTHANFYPNVSRLLQPYGWGELNLIFLGPARALTVLAAGLGLRRVASCLDSRALARACTLVALFALAAAALHIVGIARELRPGTRTPVDDVIDGWFALVTLFCALAAQLGVVGVGLLVRNQWLASRGTPPADSPGPLPIPPEQLQ
jgi:hypothetical protein